jgi:proteasome lid subunit RPN8/RPN11
MTMAASARLRLTYQQVEAIRQHGARDYPSECCGILLGHADGDQKEVREVVPLANLRHDRERAQALLPLEEPGRESERNRFLIDPREQIRVEKEARARGLDVVGYYHSHPDHPSRPSNYDRDHAWPWYSYVILAVRQAVPGEMTSWVLVEDRTRFDPEPVEMVDRPAL